MKLNKIKLFPLLLAMVMILSLAACGSDDGTGEPSNAGVSDNGGVSDGDNEPKDTYDIIKVGSTYSSATGSMEANPATGAVQASAATQYLSYESIAQINPGTGEIELVLINGYEWADNTTLVLEMKEGVTFSDGSVLDGYDVLASINYYVEAKGAQATAAYGFYDLENSSVSEDGLTLTLKYKYEFGPAIKYLCRLMVGSADFLESVSTGDEIWLDGEAVPHAGPYTKVECVLDSYERYVLRDDYWDKDAHFDVDEFIIYEYSDSTAMFIEFETGNLDLIIDITENDYNRVVNGNVSGAEGLITNSNDTQMLVFYLGGEYFQDINVRMALAHAIDTGAIATAAYGTLGQQATSVLSSAMPYYKNVGAYEYDPDYAKSLLEDAGYGSINLNWICVNNTQQATIAETVQAYAGAVGIEINLDIQEQSAAIPALMQPGASDFMLLQATGGSPYLEAYQVTTAWMSDSIFAVIRRAEDSEANQLLLTGTYNVDEAVRKKAYQNFQQLVYDEYYGIHIAEYYYANAYNSEKIDTIALLSPQHQQLRYITLN